MCGIFSIAGTPQCREQVCRGLRSLAHRGPDGNGIWQSQDATVVLGHTRLSIIDLPDGQQPMTNETGDVSAVINGEFYGYEKIMDGLTSGGHHFHTRCDSEILVHLYEEHQLEAVQHLRGEFAFVLWDEKRKRLVAGRDRFGVKPLFYSEVNGGLWLASEAKAFFAAGFEARWDAEALYHHLFLIHGGSSSLFDGVRQLLPGHLLIFERGTLTLKRYWDMDYPVCDPSRFAVLRSDEDSLSSFWEDLNDAVRVRLRADTPVGFFLSGGIDSSTVLGVAAKYWAAPGRAFTVRFDEPEYDEGVAAGGTAADFGALFAPVVLSQGDLVEAYPSAIAQGETIGNLHGAARYLQCRALNQEGYKVALTGDGADEVLAGYVHYVGDVPGASEESLPKALRPMGQKLGHVPQWVRMLAIERSIFSLLLARDYRESMRWCQPYTDCLDVVDFDGQLAGRDPLHQSLYLWNKLMLPNYVLAAERLEMAFAIETRPAFLDHVLFNSIRRLPPSALVSGRRGKNILRLAVHGMVRDSIIAQQKHPFATPSYLSQPGSALFKRVDETFRDGTLGSMPFFDTQAVIELWAQLPTLPYLRQLALEPAILIIYCACVLHQRYMCN